jgi:NADH-quinone oxidoreductase subunit N
MFNFDIPDIDVRAILPLALVALTGLIALIFEVINPKRDNRVLVFVSLLGLAMAAVTLVFSLTDPVYQTGAGMLVHDTVGNVLQLIIVVSTALVVLFSDDYLRQKRVPFGEFYPLVLWSSVGAMLMVAASNWLIVFLGLEILSIALYVMAGMSRTEEKSEESAMKYFLLGAFASGFLLYGIAFLYGATGSLQIDALKTAWLQGHDETHVMICGGLALTLVGLGFKCGFVPFHQWTPDVYQGAPTNVTAFMSTVSKVAALGALWRVIEVSGDLSNVLIPALTVIAILTMIVGNVMALAQTDVKRVLAYSSIAHSGYILAALIAHLKMPALATGTTLCYYLLSYCLMTIGSFAIVSMFARGGQESTGYESLYGLFNRSRLAAACLIVFMLSLIGLPPLAGFFGKLFILMDLVKAGMVPLAIVLACASIISAAYYLRIARAVLVPDESVNQRTSPFAGNLAFTGAVCALGVIAVTVFYTPLMKALQFEPTTTVAAAPATLRSQL